MKIKVSPEKHAFFEKIAWQKNLLVCGLDEVGRGCLAGPLVVAAVILPQNTDNALLKDSKTLKPKTLFEAYSWIVQNCHYSIITTSWQEVDRLNIYQATIQSMKKSFISLLENPMIQPANIQYVLTDAMPLKLESTFSHSNLELLYFPKGETISPSIAAASIIAKVTRDNLMIKMNKIFPFWGLEKHKGYGTKLHLNKLNATGPTIIHRKSFLSKLKCQDMQASLFESSMKMGIKYE